MRISYTILLAIFCTGCKEENKVKVVEGSDVRASGLDSAVGGGSTPGTVKAPQLKSIRNDLIQAVVDQRPIQPNPHRKFKEVVSRIPKREERTINLLNLIILELRVIDAESLSVEVITKKNALVVALQSELFGKSWIPSSFKQEIIESNVEQFIFTREAYEVAQRRGTDMVRASPSDQRRLQDELIQGLHAAPLGPAEERVRNNHTLRERISGYWGYWSEMESGVFSALIRQCFPASPRNPWNIVEAAKTWIVFAEANNPMTDRAFATLQESIIAANSEESHSLKRALLEYITSSSASYEATDLAIRDCLDD